MNAWGAYMFAAFGLVLVLSPLLGAAVGATREASDLRYLEGVAAVVNGLSPGMVVRFSFGNSPSSDPIILGRHTMSCNPGSRSVSLTSSWVLPNITLHPQVDYQLALAGSTVVVSRDG